MKDYCETPLDNLYRRDVVRIQNISIYAEKSTPFMEVMREAVIISSRLYCNITIHHGGDERQLLFNDLVSASTKPLELERP